MSRKIFVGSLPNGIDELAIRAEFEKYGQVEDVFVKQGCESGRQWSFVTFADAAQAQRTKELCDRILTFPGSERPCDVMLAKNQGMGGQPMPTGGGHVVHPPSGGFMSTAVPSANSALSVEGPKKIFVGSLPSDISDSQLRAEFAKYGNVVDTYIKQGCDPGRQWAFITFTSAAEASYAKQSSDGILTFPGQPKACEVTLARNQGMFGQDNIAPKPGGPMPGMSAMAPESAAPRKIFVGSLPDSITDAILRSEFGKYGTIIDLYLKTGCEPGRQWSFITFQNPEQANYAKASADRTLVLPGADRPVEVMLARNQGKNGQEPVSGVGAPAPAQGAPGTYMVYAQPQQQMQMGYGAQPYGAQPPPPAAPPPPHLTPWRAYYTAAGLPYYHNATSGVTQWECPPDLQVPGMQAGVPAAPPAPAMGGYGQQVAYQQVAYQPVAYQQAPGVRYAPY